VKIKIDDRNALRLLKDAEKVAENVGQKAYQYFKDITPKRSGNAQRNTKYDRGTKTITADYPYAERLDKGWSKQAPKGMTEPTEKQLEKWVEEEVRKL